MRRVTLFASALGVTCASAAWASSGYIAVSDFDTGTDGWTMYQPPSGLLAAPTFGHAGGNPGGHIYFRDVMDGYTFFQAPAKFLGDISGAYGQSLMYDIFDTEGTHPVDPTFDVILSGAGMTIQFDSPGHPGSTWTTCIIPLVASGWVHSDTMAPVSESDMLSIMGSATSLRLVGEYLSGYDLMALDNVKLIPGPSALAILGLAVVSTRRRRR